MKHLFRALLILSVILSFPVFSKNQDKEKDVVVIFEVEYIGATFKSIPEGFLTDAITKAYAEGSTFSIVDRDTLYYFFKQMQEKTKKPCEEPECLADLASQLDAEYFIKSQVAGYGNKCSFSGKLYKRKPNTLLYFVHRTEIEDCDCGADGLKKAAHILGIKLAGRVYEDKIPGKNISGEIKTWKEYNPKGTAGGPMLLVPEGEFIMGSDVWEQNEMPSHKVFLEDFYIDEYEVTNIKYRKCIEAGACQEPDLNTCYVWMEDRWKQGVKLGEDFKRDRYPVVCVKWEDANSYCMWAGKRLPTEAEWEKAARGTDGRTYPWGNEAATCEYAVMYDGGIGCERRGSNQEVGSKPKGASPYGAMDMAGNVWEWVADWRDEKYYLNSPYKMPKGPATGTLRVLRGGSWDYAKTVRSTIRSAAPPVDYRSSHVGFRCVYSSR